MSDERMIEDDGRMLDMDGISVLAANDITQAELFQIDQNMARGEDYLNGLTEILAGNLIEYRNNHGAEAHPGRHLASEDFLRMLAALDEHQAKGMLQIACWVLAEQAVAQAEAEVFRQQLLEAIQNHQCNPNCDEDGHDFS